MRDVQAAAQRLMAEDDAGLVNLATHDPSMIRDVAAAFDHRVAKAGNWSDGPGSQTI